MQQKITIIGGTSYIHSSLLQNQEIQNIHTPWGKIRVKELETDQYILRFIARHDSSYLVDNSPRPKGDIGHYVGPRYVNYQGNIWAGVIDFKPELILTISACGSLSPRYPVGSLVLAKDSFDFTQGNRSNRSFFQESVVHIQPNPLYCPELSGKIAVLYPNLRTNGQSVCIPGPQFSTEMESNIYRKTFCVSIVEMTSSPEAWLIREAQASIPNPSHHARIWTVTDLDAEKEYQAEQTSISQVSRAITVNLDQLISKILSSRIQIESRDCCKIAPIKESAIYICPHAQSSEYNLLK